MAQITARRLVAVRGAVIVPIAHCETRGCPFGWPADTRRTLCPDHDDDDPLRRAREELGIGELAATAPGDRRTDGPGQPGAGGQ